MNEHQLEVYCNGTTFTYDIPDEWPECSDLAVCQAPPDIIYGLMKYLVPNNKSQYIMENEIVQ